MALFEPSCYPLSMQIKVEIPDELAAQVQARGMTPECYVRSLIDNAARTALASLPQSAPKIDMKTFLQEMAAHSDKIPQLPDEALTRESFYQDHD
jgi:hypothetical protein